MVAHPQDGDVTILRCGVISGPVLPNRCDPAVDHNVVRSAERTGINERRKRFWCGEALRSDGYRMLRPADRKLRVDAADPAVAARIAEKNHMVPGEVGFRHIFVVLDPHVAPEGDAIPLRSEEHTSELQS